VSKRLFVGITCFCLQVLTNLQSHAATVDLQLYPLTGEVRLANLTATPFSFIFYEIDSSNMALDPTKWIPIAGNYDVNGNGFIDPTHAWNAVPGTTSQLVETAIAPGSLGTLPPFRSISLGRIWKSNTVPIDYLGTPIVKLPDGTDATVVKDLVLDGDYTANGVVNQFDYLAWIMRFGQTDSPSTDGNHNGIVDIADYTIWRDHLGQSLTGFSLGQGNGAGALSAAGVPEPSSAILALLAAGALGWRARARQNLGC
jgi:hypothetical protein